MFREVMQVVGSDCVAVLGMVGRRQCDDDQIDQTYGSRARILARDGLRPAGLLRC